MYRVCANLPFMYAFLEWTIYFLLVYFWALLGASPLKSGVNVFSINAFLIPAVGLVGGLLSKFGRYKPIYWTGFAFLSQLGSLFHYGLKHRKGQMGFSGNFRCFRIRITHNMNPS